MLDKLQLQRELLANRHKWIQSRVGFIWDPGAAFNYQLAVAQHLFYLRGIQCGLECPVWVSASRIRYIDILIPLALLAIEIDGSHHFEDRHIISDQDRTVELEALGLRVERFTNYNVLQRFPQVIQKIMHVCAERGYRPDKSFLPSIVMCRDPTPHYLLNHKNPDGSALHQRIELHSQKARDLGLEYLDGESTFL
jgi:hypothetical protein